MKWITYVFEALRNYRRVKDELARVTAERNNLKKTIEDIEKFIDTHYDKQQENS